VPLVSKPAASACFAERLAWAASSPNRSVVGPSGETERVAPDADPGEEVALSIFGNVIWLDVSDVSFIYISRCNVASINQVAQPLSAIRIRFIVIGYGFSHG
jgi:hypothetical protein